MPVTEALMAPGSWSITLKPGTPRSIIDNLQYFQHVVISTGRHNPQLEGSSLFTSGRFTGFITGLDFQTENQGRGPVISGDCMNSWLGNGSKVGPVIEANNTPTSSANGAFFTSAAYSTVVNTLVNVSSLQIGTIYPMPTSATFTGAFIWKTVADSLTSFATQVTQGSLPTQIAEWRVNNNATVDFGPVASLYRTTPITAIVPNSPGLDMNVRGLDGVAELIEDVKDYTTRVVVLASGSGVSTAVGTANSADVGASNPYTDFYGNPVNMVRMVSASGVSSVNATASAQAALIPYTTPADQVRLSSSEYDIKGDLVCGDYVWLYDPDAGFVDTSGTNEIVYRGQRINPTLQRVIQLNWPVTSDMTVAYRDQSGTWYDLTDYVQFEDGSQTTLTVGGFNRNLVPTSEPVGSRPIPDTTIPGVPVFGTFYTTVYQGPSDGKTQAQIQLNWSTPANTDGTTMTDLSHYEIQYRPDVNIFTTNPSYNGIQSAGYTYNSLASLAGSYNQLIPQAQADWKVTFVAGGVNNLLVQELTPGVEYEFQIRAVDTASPPNYGAWSGLTVFQANVDTIPPPAPDAPTVAANMASVQVTWDCGTSDGGTFTQAADLNHVEVHGSYAPTFVPSTATKLGNMPANVGNITGQIPVVGSFTIPPGQPPATAMYIKLVAVDTAGNKSAPSASAGATAQLWSDAYITDLSVSKLTAGTITASIILGGTIETASSGVRAGMDSTGLWCYNSSNYQTFHADATTGAVTVSSGGTGARVGIDSTGIWAYASDGVTETFLADATTGQITMRSSGGQNYLQITNSFDLTPYGVPQQTNALVFYTDNLTSPAVIATYNTSIPGAGATWEIAAAPVSLSSGSAPWGVASSYVPALSLKSGGAATLAYADASSTNFSGGSAQVGPQFALLGMANEGGLAGGLYISQTGSSNTEPKLEIMGYWGDNGAGAPSGIDGRIQGNITGIGSGTTSFTWSYGSTMASTTIPIVNVSCGTTTTTPAAMNSGFNTTGFTVHLSAGPASSFSIFFIASRIR